MITPSIRSQPESTLRTSVLVAAALGLVVVISTASIASSVVGLTTLYPAKAAVVFAAIVVTALYFVGGYHPYSRFGPANQVTLTRAMLVALVAGLLGEPTTRAAAWLAATLAGVGPVLDGVDGWFARRTRMQSAFGARFDVEIDSLHVLVMAGLIWQFDKAGAWVWLGALLRYAFVASGWLLPWMARPLRPTRRARVIAIVHMVTLSVGIAPFMPATPAATAIAIAIALLSWSFMLDIGRLWRGEGAT
jgi:phosphatidylglycerophosphate synthase